MAKTASRLSAASRAVAAGGKLVKGGYMLPSGTYMKTSGGRMSAAAIRAAEGMPHPPPPLTGVGSGETRVSTRAPAGMGPAKQKAVAALQSASRPLTAAEKAVATEAGLPVDKITAAKELLGKVTGSTVTKVTAGATAATGATAAAIKSSGTATPANISEMSVDQLNAYLEANPDAASAARDNGGSKAVATVQRVAASRVQDKTDLEALILQSDITAAEAAAQRAAIKAEKARRAARP